MLKNDCIAFGVALSASLLIAATTGPSASEVRAMMARVPIESSSIAAPAHYERVGDARIIAQAIAHVARTRYEAAELVVYGAYESGYQKCAEGDRDEHGVPKALGAWQLQGVTRELACDPEHAARYWLATAEASREKCASNPPDERLAALVSGSCAHGHVKSRYREAVVRLVMR